MVDPSGWETKDPLYRCNTLIKPNPHILIPKSPVTPSEREAIKPQIFQPTKVQCISKTLHLSFRLVQAPSFFFSQNYFIEIPIATEG